MSDDLVLLDVTEGLATVELNRPEAQGARKQRFFPPVPRTVVLTSRL